MDTKKPTQLSGFVAGRVLWSACVGVLLIGCIRRDPYHADASEDSAPPQAEAECIIQEEEPMRSFLPSQYAKMCEAELGVFPTIDCGKGVTMPVYVDGVEVYEDPGPDNCDNPHATVCTPGSSLQRHVGVHEDGTPWPEVVWVGFCRHDQQTEDGENHVQVIGHNTETGATCFFGRADNEPYTWIDPETSQMMGELPGPDDPGFDDAFAVSIEESGPNRRCVICHASNPFIHTEWIDSAVLDEATGEPVVPYILGPKTPYYVVGAPEWDMRTLYIEDNQCLGCHRVGFEAIRNLREQPWFVDEEMPPAHPGSLSEDYAELLNCWSAGPENTPGCDWIVPPAGDCDQRVVGEEYPNISEHYNIGADMDEPM